MDELVFEKKVSLRVSVENLVQEGIEYAKEFSDETKGEQIPWWDIMMASGEYYDHGYFDAVAEDEIFEVEKKITEVCTKLYNEKMGF